MDRHYRITRRTFIRHIGYAGVALPLVAPALVRAASANEKLNIAMIGTHNQAAWNLKQIGDQNIVALCDVDATFLGAAAELHPNARIYRDYRRLLDKEQANIDAVVAAIPDHHHAQVTLRAIALGKHVYCEKPLAHTIHETRLVRTAAKRAGVVTQMGTQIHATDHYRRMVEIVQSGALGPVRQVHIWQYGYNTGSRFPEQTDTPPDTLDWDMWLGPAAERPYYDKLYHPFTWRGWWDFGGGILSDIACHVVDLVHWALDLKHPNTVQAFGSEPMPLRAPRSLKVQYDYPVRGAKPAVKLFWYHGGSHIDDKVAERYNVPEWKEGRSIMFVGDRGNLLTSYDKHVMWPAEKFADFTPPAPTIPPSIGHHNEWIKACKEGTPTMCNFEYSGTLTEAVLLGLVSHRAGNVKIEFDAAKARVTNHAAANEFITKPYRKGWDIDRLV